MVIWKLMRDYSNILVEKEPLCWENDAQSLF